MHSTPTSHMNMPRVRSLHTARSRAKARARASLRSSRCTLPLPPVAPRSNAGLSDWTTPSRTRLAYASPSSMLPPSASPSRSNLSTLGASPQELLLPRCPLLPGLPTPTILFHTGPLNPPSLLDSPPSPSPPNVLLLSHRLRHVLS